MEKQIATLLEKGLTRPSNSPYGAPVLFLKKPDGSLRMCIDYRAVNKITVKDKYPLPLIDALLDQLAGARYSLYLEQAYLQVRITPADVPKTAFRTQTGSYEWLVLPFGLTNAPATFQAVVNNVFRERLYKFVLAYLDDILVYSRTMDEHVRHLREVLELLRKAQLQCKAVKCKFAATSVKFLGHVITDGKVQADPG